MNEYKTSLMLQEAINMWLKGRTPEKWKKHLQKYLKEEMEIIKIKQKEYKQP